MRSIISMTLETAQIFFDLKTSLAILKGPVASVQWSLPGLEYTQRHFISKFNKNETKHKSYDDKVRLFVFYTQNLIPPILKIMSHVERSCRKKILRQKQLSLFNIIMCNIHVESFSVPHIILCPPAVIVSGVRLLLGVDVN